MGRFTRIDFGVGRDNLKRAWAKVNGYFQRLFPRTYLTDSTDTLTPNVDNYDVFELTAQGEDLYVDEPIGTPDNNEAFVIKIKDDATSRGLSFNEYSFRGIVSLPTATTISKWLFIACVWNATDSIWDVLSVTEQA